jgi:hypothetical protein
VRDSTNAPAMPSSRPAAITSGRVDQHQLRDARTRCAERDS